MKKFLSTMLLLVVTTAMLFAQEVTLPVTSNTDTLYRVGSKYHYGDVVMNRRECRDFMLYNQQVDAYKQFKSGYQMYTAGWSLMGIGLAADAFSIGFSVGLLASFKQDPDAPTMGPMLAILLVSVPILAGGLAFNITSIPLICVGNKRMNASVDAYNIAQPTATKPYLSLQTTQNGVGLALKF